MAYKEEENDAPPYIDYGGESTSSETWTGADIINCFTETLRKDKKVSVSISSQKERSLAKKISQEYQPEEIQKMIKEWVKWETQHFHNFTHFYMVRHKIAASLKPKDYTWE